MVFSLLGMFMSIIIGAQNPFFGALMIKCIFGMLSLTEASYETATKVMNEWVFWLAILTVILFFATSLKGIFFGFVSENITENLRRDLYQSVFRKHIGWHDVRSNNSGVITAVLAGECTQLQGLSGEAVGVIFESIFSLIFAIGVAFYFSWPMALVALGIAPLMGIGAAL